jgi:Tfp pilus assembly protein PilF
MQEDSSEKERPHEPPAQNYTPMQVASLRMTDQARRYLEKKDTESAIRTLERAVSLHPSHGENYYLLAEAWRIKGNREQALEFNRLAGMYLKHDRSWMERIEIQRSMIQQKR